ncbi:MAG: hypothetical protein HY796_10680 [Elusimicrobia bacterium]|nr:hypothetical protein [Elusimicrobiota bacterium]
MISFTTVSEKFNLDLEPNFSELLGDYILKKSGTQASAAQQDCMSRRLKSNKLSLIGLKDLLAGLSVKASWCGEPSLKQGEQLNLTHLESPDCAMSQGYTLLKAMFNQFAPNDMFRVAWSYIAEDAERKYGVLFIERQREEQKQEESAIYEFWSFIYVNSQDRITHYAHHLDHFVLEKSLRMQLVFMGFGNTGNLIAQCNRDANPMLMFKFKNIFNSIINPLYTFVQDGPGPGANRTAP